MSTYGGPCTWLCLASIDGRLLQCIIRQCLLWDAHCRPEKFCSSEITHCFPTQSMTVHPGHCFPTQSMTSFFLASYPGPTHRKWVGPGYERYFFPASESSRYVYWKSGLSQIVRLRARRRSTFARAAYRPAGRPEHVTNVMRPASVTHPTCSYVPGIYSLQRQRVHWQDVETIACSGSACLRGNLWSIGIVHLRHYRWKGEYLPLWWLWFLHRHQ